MVSTEFDCSLVSPEPCPGRYCGRILNETAETAEQCFRTCGACPRGYRIENGSSECLQCDEEAVLRDYMFLGFFCLVCIMTRLSILGVANRTKPTSFIKLGIAIVAVVENLLAMLLALLVYEPLGRPWFNACRVSSVSDFYPIFFNPSLDYVHELRCTYEVVYPLYSLVFVFFGFSFLLHLLSLVALVPVMVKSKRSIHSYTEFSWLVAFPIIVLLYAVLPGILYYSFDYLTVILSLGVFVVFTTLSEIKIQSTASLYKMPEHMVFIAVCMLSLAFGIVALTDGSTVEVRLKLLPLILAPPILHPILSFFATPKLYLTAWGLSD